MMIIIKKFSIDNKTLKFYASSIITTASKVLMEAQNAISVGFPPSPKPKF